jgi:hypothetical protein
MEVAHGVIVHHEKSKGRCPKTQLSTYARIVLDTSRVARFFYLQHTKMGKIYVTNDYKV